MSILDENFAYALVSSSDRTLRITGVNIAKYHAGNANWGSFPAIPELYAGGTPAYNGYGATENAFVVVEITSGAFNGRTEFAEGPLVLPKTLLRIGDNAFKGVKITGRLTIPASVTQIGANAFDNTLIDELLVENAALTDLLSGVVDATRVTSKETEARVATDTVLTGLKVTKAEPVFTGTTTIATAAVSEMKVSSHATVQTANIATGSVTNTATVDYYEPNVSEKNKNARFRVLTTAGNLLSVGGVNENLAPIEVVLTNGTYRTGAALVAALVTALNAKNIAWVGGPPMQTISWINTSFDAITGKVKLGYSTDAPGSLEPSIVIRTKFASNGVSYNSSSLLGAVSANIGGSDEPGAFIVTYGNRFGLSFPQAINLGTPVLNVNGDAKLAGSGTVNGNWNFIGNKPRYNAEVLATESFTLSKIQAINGTSLLSTVKTLADVASAIGADPQFAVKVQAAQSAILQSVVSLTSVRSTEVSSLSSALSSQVSALQSTDASLSSAISGAVPVRVSQVESVSAVLETAVSQMQSADVSISTALSTATSQRSTQTLSLNSAISTTASLLQNADTALSTGLSTATLTRSVNISTNSSMWSAHVSVLQTVDASLSTAVVGAASARSNAVSSLASLVSTTVPGLVVENTVLRLGISTATTNRVASIVSVTNAISTQISTAQSLNAVLLPQITAAASTAPAATTNTVFNLVGINVNDVLTFQMSSGSGGFATGNKISIIYSPTDFLKGTVTAVSGSNITFQVNQKATTATETSIYNSTGQSMSWTSSYATTHTVPIFFPFFTANSNFVITSVTASWFTDIGLGTYQVSLLNASNAIIATSLSRQVNATGAWNAMHTHRFTSAFVLNGATNLKLYLAGPDGRAVITGGFISAFTTMMGYAVNYISGSVHIESNGALQSTRISAVGALSTSALGQVSSLATLRLSNQSGIALQTSERTASVSSIMSVTAQSVTSLQAATSAHGSAVSVAVSARNSGVSSLTSSINASVSSVSSLVTSISGAVSTQVANRSSQVLTAVTSLVGAAPASLDTLFEIAATLDAGPTLYSTLDSTETLAASNTTARITTLSAVSSSLSTVASTLQLADASLSLGISSAVSVRTSQAASVSSGVSTVISSARSTQSATSAGISSTVSLRASGVASISTALAALSTAAQLSDLSAGGSITTAISARQSGTASTSTVLSTAVSGFESVGAALSSAVSTAVSVRQSGTASVSTALSTEVSGQHQTLVSLASVQSALSAGINVSALANLSDVNSAIGALVGVGAVTALDTLNELATAISNDATVGTTLIGLLNDRATQSDVAALSSAVLLKASQADLTQLVSTVGTKVGDASVTQLESAVTSMTVVTTSVSSQVQILQTNMAASSQTIGLLSDIIRQIDTLYEYIGSVDANGSIIYAVNKLADMVLVSSSLVFTINPTTYAVSKVAQLAVVRFDPTQTSFTYSNRGVGPIPVSLPSGTHTHTFSIDSSSATDYANNATSIVITADPTALRTAPANSPFTVPKLALSGYTYATPTVVTPYAATTWSDATGKTSQVITINFESGVQHLEVGGMVYAVAGTTQLIHTLEYLPGATGTLVIKAMNSATKLESASLSLSDVYTDYPQHAAPAEVGGSKTVTVSGSTYTYTATYTTTASTVEVYDYDTQTSAYSAVATSVPVVGGQVSVSRSYLIGQAGQPLFQLRAKTGDGKRSGTFVVATAEAITFIKPVRSSVSYTTLSAGSYRATFTYTLALLATKVKVINPSTDGTYITETAASGGSATFSVDYTEAQGATIAVITLANAAGLQSVASDPFTPIGQYNPPVQVAGSKTVTLSSGTYTHTAQYTSASPDGINVYAADGVTLVGSSTGASSPFTVTITYAADKFGQTVALLSSKETVNKRESAKTTSIVGEDLLNHATPVISGGITYGTSGSNNTAQMNYSVTSNVDTLRVLKADQTQLPAGSTSVQQSIVSTTGATRVISVTVTFTNAVAPLNIVVVAEANAYSKQSAASAAQTLLGLHAAPTISGSISYSGNTATMTYSVESGVTQVMAIKGTADTYSINPASDMGQTLGIPITLTDFPVLNAYPLWDMKITFRSTGKNSQWRALIGEMRNGIVDRGWGVWISDQNKIHFSWNSPSWNTSLTVAQNTDYELIFTKTTTSLKIDLKNVVANTTQTDTNASIAGYVMSESGLVTLGGWINMSTENFVGTISNVNVVPALAPVTVSGGSATVNVPVRNAESPLNVTVVALANSVGRESAASAQQTLLARFPAPTISGSISYSGNTATMTYNVASGVDQVQVRNASNNSVLTTTSVSGTTATINLTVTANVNIVVVALEKSGVGRESPASAQQSLLKQYDAPTLSTAPDSLTYSGTTATVKYNVATGVTAVQVRNAADNSVLNTTSVSGTTATINLTIAANVNIVVVAVGNASGRDSPASAPQTLIKQFTAPTISGSISYSGNTATMTYNVASGVDQVQVRNASNNSVLTTGVTTSVSGTTATINVTITENTNIVVVALDNSGVGRESPASAQQSLLKQYDAPTLNDTITYSGTTATVKYNVASGVTAVQVRNASDNSVLTTGVTTISVLGNIATIEVDITIAANVNIVVVALGNENGRDSPASIAETLISLAPELRYSGTFPTNDYTATRNTTTGLTSLINGIAVDASANVYLSSQSGNKIAVYNANDQIVTSFGSSGAGNGQFNLPGAVAIDALGNVVVVDKANNRIQMFTKDGTHIRSFGSAGTGDGQFQVAYGLTIDANNNIYVSDSARNNVQKFTNSGVFISKFGSAGSGNGQFNLAAGMAIDESGNIYIVDTNNYRVQVFDKLHNYISQKTFTDKPQEITIDASDTIFVSFDKNTISIHAMNWDRIDYFGFNGSGVGQFNFITGLVVDKNGTLFVADRNNNRFQSFGTSPQPTVGQILSTPVMVSGPTYQNETVQFTFEMDLGVSAIKLSQYNDALQRWDPLTIVVPVSVTYQNTSKTLVTVEVPVIPFSLGVTALSTYTKYQSLISAAVQIIASAFTAPTLTTNSLTYSGNTANMTYDVATGVTHVEVRNATTNAVIPSTTSVNTTNKTASVSVTYTTENVSIVVVALGNLSGRESAPSASLIVGQNRFPAPVRGTGATAIIDNVYKTSLPYTVASGVIAIQTNNASAQTSLSGTTATVVFSTETTTSISVSALGNGAYATSLPDTYTRTTALIPKTQISGYDGSVSSTVVHNATFGSSGTGNFGFNSPRGIAHFYENTGTDTVPVIRRFLFVSNSGSNNVKVYSNASSNVASLSYHSVIGSLNNPAQIACFHQNDTGSGSTVSLRMAFADSNNHRIMIYNLVVDANGVLTINLAVALGTLGSGVGTTISPQFNYPQGVAYTRTGALFVADTNNHRIQAITTNNILASTSVSGIWGTQGTGNGQFNFPSSIAVNSLANIIVGCNNGVQIFSSTRTFLTKISTIVSPSVAVDNAGVGKIIVTNPATNQVHVFSSGGALITTFGSGLLNNPSGVTVDNYGNIYVCDRGNNRIQYFESVPSGSFAAPVFLSGSITYSGTTASMTYTVASDVNEVEVQKSSDRTVISDATFLIVGTTATITVPFMDNAVAPLDIVVVALANPGVGLQSPASAVLRLVGVFAAPIKASGPTYTLPSAESYTANMTYTVASGVTEVQVRNASNNSVLTTTSVSGTIATISVTITASVSIVVVAVGNPDVGRESAPSVAQPLTYAELLLNANGMTIQYTGSAALVPTSTPLYIYANPTGSGMQWYAVVKQTTGNLTSLTPPGQSSPVLLNNVVTTLITDMSNFFNNKDGMFGKDATTGAYKNQMTRWDTSNVTTMASMFKYNNSAINDYYNIRFWNTANVTNMSEMFMDAINFNTYIGSWNTAKVNNMNRMFSGATKFNQDISSWNTSAVLDMSYMFYNATAFNQNISGWDVDQAQGGYYTFGGGSALSVANTPPNFRQMP